jgi:hypothetical protein
MGFDVNAARPKQRDASLLLLLLTFSQVVLLIVAESSSCASEHIMLPLSDLEDT